MNIAIIKGTRINVDTICSYRLVEMKDFGVHANPGIQAKICIDLMGSHSMVFDFEVLKYAQDTLNYLDKKVGIAQED